MSSGEAGDNQMGPSALGVDLSGSVGTGYVEGFGFGVPDDPVSYFAR